MGSQQVLETKEAPVGENLWKRGGADAPKVGADVILMGGAALITPKQNEDKHVLYTVLGCGVSNFSAF